MGEVDRAASQLQGLEVERKVVGEEHGVGGRLLKRCGIGDAKEGVAGDLGGIAAGDVTFVDDRQDLSKALEESASFPVPEVRSGR